MPKRKRNEEETIARKIRKLEKKLKKRKNRRARIISSSSEDFSQPPQNQTDEVNRSPLNDNTEFDSIVCEVELQQQGNNTALLTSQEEELKLQADNPASASSTLDSVPDNTELDSAILEILGDDPTSTVVYGKDIRPELAARFNHITINGLNKDLRKELGDKYLIPGNCTLIGAPVLNPEVKAALNENTLKRDKLIESRQKRMAVAISCLDEALSSALSAKEKDNAQIKRLMDTARLICDAQYNDSVSRRNLAVYALKKEMKEPLLNTKIDKALFGEGLSESLKASKAVNKSGTELKTPFKPPAKNWKPPVAGRRQPAFNRRGMPSTSTTPVQPTTPAMEPRARRTPSLRRPPPQPTRSTRRRY